MLTPPVAVVVLPVVTRSSERDRFRLCSLSGSIDALRGMHREKVLPVRLKVLDLYPVIGCAPRLLRRLVEMIRVVPVPNDGACRSIGGPRHDRAVCGYMLDSR